MKWVVSLWRTSKWDKHKLLQDKKIKKKEEMNRKYLLAGATYSTLLEVRRPRVGLTSEDGLTDYTLFLITWRIYKDTKVK